MYHRLCRGDSKAKLWCNISVESFFIARVNAKAAFHWIDSIFWWMEKLENWSYKTSLCSRYGLINNFHFVISPAGGNLLWGLRKILIDWLCISLIKHCFSSVHENLTNNLISNLDVTVSCSRFVLDCKKNRYFWYTVCCKGQLSNVKDFWTVSYDLCVKYYKIV